MKEAAELTDSEVGVQSREEQALGIIPPKSHQVGKKYVNLSRTHRVLFSVSSEGEPWGSNQPTSCLPYYDGPKAHGAWAFGDLPTGVILITRAQQ